MNMPYNTKAFPRCVYLYQKYASFFSEEEYQFMIHMMKSLYPKERYQDWLKD